MRKQGAESGSKYHGFCLKVSVFCEESFSIRSILNYRYHSVQYRQSTRPIKVTKRPWRNLAIELDIDAISVDDAFFVGKW